MTTERPPSPDREEADGERRILERLVPEIIKRIVEAGFEKITEGPENVRKVVGDLKLPKEALGTQRRGQLGMEDFECDRAVVPQVAREPDRGHAPAAELALERVPIAQPFAQCRHRVRHVVPSTSFLNLGCSRSGSKVGSTRSHAGDR